LFAWFWACPHPSKHGCASGWMNISNTLKNGNKDLSATEIGEKGSGLTEYLSPKKHMSLILLDLCLRKRKK
jgi:hypothetical protein